MHQRNQKANHSFCNYMIRVSQSFPICHLDTSKNIEVKSPYIFVVVNLASFVFLTFLEPFCNTFQNWENQ
eukprot:UN03353